MVIEARRSFGHPIFREIMITACWVIWKLRNNIIFDNGNCSLSSWKHIFKEELGLVCIKAKQAIKAPLSLWRELLLMAFLFLCLGLDALYFLPLLLVHNSTLYFCSFFLLNMKK
jgi:hypothetical protein